MPISYRQLSQPSAEPVTVTEAKAHLRIDGTESDDLLALYITAAREYAEKFCQRAFFTRAVRMTLDVFPLSSETYGASTKDTIDAYYRALGIRLPLPALASDPVIRYKTDAGDTITLDPSGYVSDTVSEPARIMPASGSTWPSANTYLPGQITIDYEAGCYGDGSDLSLCPSTVKVAILLLTGHFFNNREASSAETLTTIPLGVEYLLAGERVMSCYD